MNAAIHVATLIQVTLIAVNIYTGTHNPGCACAAWIFSYVLFYKLDGIREAME